MQWFHRRSTKCGRGRRRRRRTNSARISHPPPFRRVTKNESVLLLLEKARSQYELCFSENVFEKLKCYEMQ